MATNFPNVDLPRVLESLGYVNFSDFEVRDNNDGEGPHISAWNSPDPQPTDNDITTQWNALQSQDQLNIVPKAKARALREIDTYAEFIRAKYITSQPGQVAAYNEKYLDAKAYKDAGYPPLGSPVQYPFVKAEASAMNATPQEAADLIVMTRNYWIVLAARIEEERRRGKINVDAASTTNEVDNVKQAALDALNLI